MGIWHGIFLGLPVSLVQGLLLLLLEVLGILGGFDFCPHLIINHLISSPSHFWDPWQTANILSTTWEMMDISG